ncbi:MAG: peptidoglycan DD-metalloendopeptidase family protein, partial [Atopobiaceae bacterium]|nr:peptidoglycan DD-metalloendopeptidase family protein [Atopobiaceae bacterium]
DIVIPEGSDVLAAMGGTVKYIHRYNALTSRDDTTMNSYGMLVILYHDNGTTTYYAHMRDITVSEGQRVSQGAVIGHVGLTGNTTGYHLHFELRTGANATPGNTGTGTRQNPLNYVSPSNLFEGTSGSNPIGFVDAAEGRDGKVYIWGWAYDPDDPYAAVQVHVYIGGPSGVGEGHNGIMANLPRSDVNNVMGIVGNHGFETVINTNRRGSVDIHAYAMNIGGGDTNPQLVNVFTVTVTNPKVITKIWTSDVTFAGYYINCNINPDVGAARVQFPTWTVHNSQDDLAPEWWSSSATAGKKVNSTTWRYYVKTSDHNEERGDYVTHIYVYDANGNTIEQFTSGIGVNVKPGDVSKATVSAISNKQYTGKAISPKPTVKLSGTTLKLNTDYTLSYKNNVKTGTASVIIKGKGRCTGSKTVTFKIVTPGVTYRTHVQNVGWQGWKKNGAMSGTSGQALRLEGINIKLENKPVSGGITYRTHVQNIGWQGWRSDGAMSGTSGKALRLEAIQIKLTGKMVEKYDIYYRVHCQNIGWMGWAKNGQSAGSAGYAYRLEGIQVVLVPKGKSAPSATYKGITANTKQRFSQR